MFGLKSTTPHWRIYWGRPLRPKIFSISCRLFGKFGKIVCWRPPPSPEGWCSSYGESWIRPCTQWPLLCIFGIIFICVHGTFLPNISPSYTCSTTWLPPDSFKFHWLSISCLLLYWHVLLPISIHIEVIMFTAFCCNCHERN